MQDLEIPIWKEAPFVRIIIPLIAGIIFQWYVHPDSLICISGLVTSILLQLLFFFLPLHIRYRYHLALGIVILLMIFFMGMIMTRFSDDRIQRSWYGNMKDVQAMKLIVTDDPELKPKTVKFIAAVSEVISNNQMKQSFGRMLVFTEKLNGRSALKKGDVILFRKKPQQIVNSGNPGEFDKQRYMRFHHCYEQLYLTKNDYIKTASLRSSLLSRFIDSLQQKTLSTLRHYLSGDPASLGIAEALLIGYKGDLDNELVQSYSQTGVVHIIAISGLHLGLIYMMLVFLLDLIPLPDNIRWLKSILIISALWIFTLVSGASASVLRSAVMFTLIVTGKQFNREGGIYNSLAASAFLLLIYNPYMLWDVGFQLSYLAIIGIVWLQKPVENCFHFKYYVSRKVWEMCSITIAAQIFTTPICLFYFHQFPNYFLLSNLMAVPVSTAILFAEIFLLLLSPFPLSASYIAEVTSWLIRFLNEFIKIVSQLPYSVTENIYADVLSTLLFYLAVFFLFYGWTKKRKALFLTGSLFLTFCISWVTIVKLKSTAQKRILIYNIKGNSLLTCIQGNRFYCFGDSSVMTDPFLNRMYIKPVRQKWLLRENPVCYFRKLNNSFLLKMGGKKIWITDQDFRKINNNESPRPDWILVTHGSNLKMKDLADYGRNAMLIFDASNPLWKIRQWKKECDTLHLRCISTTEEGAWIVDLP